MANKAATSVDYDRYVIALVDNQKDRHVQFRMYPGVHKDRKCFRIKHIHNLSEFRFMMNNDTPDFLFMSGWLQQYQDWKVMCDLVIDADVIPRLVILTTMDAGRAEDMLKHVQQHAPDVVIAHSPWNKREYGMRRLEPREYWIDD